MALLNTPNFRITPSSIKVQRPENYISYFDFSSQYLPDRHDELVAIYGNQGISDMLRMLGAEEAFASDQVIWTEKGRLHTSYNNVSRSGNVFTIANHVYRVGETVHVSGTSDKAVGIITAVTKDTFTAQPYASSGWGSVGTADLKVFVYGSEFRKGTDGMQGSLETDFTVLRNKPIILKDKYEVSGSEATQIGWVKTDQGGYLWYLQSELDTRRRYEDRVEMALLFGEEADAGSGAEQNGYGGTEGLFQAIRRRGNVYDGLAQTIPDWDTVLKRFDAQGKIQDYMFYCDRDQSLAIDNMLGELNAGYSSGVSYGIFENGEDMAVDLGFIGFRRGTYNFFKKDWKLLNDPTLEGGTAAAADKIRGVLVPVGMEEVYEGAGTTGERHKMPYLQMKYRVAGNENRKYKTWVTGSVGGVSTDDVDVMRVNHLSERVLCTTSANNFMLFEGNS